MSDLNQTKTGFRESMHSEYLSYESCTIEAESPTIDWVLPLYLLLSRSTEKK